MRSTRSVRAARVRRTFATRRRVGGQGGFALIAGLMVWFAVCGATLIALMGMTLSASKISAAQSVTARQVRAADAALDAAVTQIRMDPTGTIGAGDGSGGCERGPGPSGSKGLTYDDGIGTSVLVTATCEGSSRQTAATGSAAAATFDVVGDSYRSPGWLPDTVQWATDCATSAVPSCYPWRAALGAPNYTANAAAIPALGPTVVHTSDASVPTKDSLLSLAGTVRVQRSALAMIDPPRVAGSAGLSVSGSYAQAQPGAFAAVGGTDNCGMVGPSFPWNVNGSQIIDSDDANGRPSCGMAVATLTDGLAAPARWTSVEPLRSTPSCSRDKGSVVTFEPGAYTSDQTSAINDLLGGDCPARVMWFRPGAYWFDVDDRTNAAFERNSLLFDDPTVRVLFGRPSGGDSSEAAATAEFPEACDPTASGVSITLTPRTSLRHRQGQVAVCDVSTSGAADSLPPAIWQTASADGGWAGTPDPRKSEWGIATTDRPEDGWLIDARSSAFSADCPATTAADCDAVISLRANDIGADTPEPTAQIASQAIPSLELLVRATSPNDTSTYADTSRPATTIQLIPAGESAPICGAAFRGVPDPRTDQQFTLAYDLFSPVVERVEDLRPCSELANSRELTRSSLRGSTIVYSTRVASFIVDGLELRAGWDLTGSAATDADGWADPQNVLVADGRLAEFDNQRCKKNECPEQLRSMVIRGLDNVADPHVPTDGRLTSAGVVVIGESSTSKNDSPKDLAARDEAWIGATLTLADRSTCTMRWPSAPLSSQGLYLDLLLGDGDCPELLQNSAQLIDASLQFQMFTTGTKSKDDDGTGIDQIRISTVSDGAYLGPMTPNLLTQAVGDSASGTSFNVFGPYSTPRNDLNVQWSGNPPRRASGRMAPVLGGQTVVSALGSFVGRGGAAGVLCCADTRPAERIVDLRAIVSLADGSQVVMGTARVRISDVGTFGSAVTVDDWNLRSGEVVSGPTTTTTRPPGTTTTTTPAPSAATWTMVIRSDWGRGYCADVTVRNPTGSPVNWVVDVPVEGTITSLWNADHTRSGDTIRASGLSWNSPLAGGASTVFGFCSSR